MEKRASRIPTEEPWDFYCGPIDYSDPLGRHLLKQITLELSPPCLCVISGPSGCGKTSLLRAICGLNDAKVGTRRLGSENFPERKLSLWRTQVTLLLQDAPCIPGTIADNLSFPFSFKNNPGKSFRKDLALELLKRVKLDHFGLEHQVDGLSGGERHRLALARGLLWAPPVLLADEPLSGLEPELAQECFRLLVEYSRTPPSVVICVLHEERFAKQADISLRLKNGTLHRTD